MGRAQIVLPELISPRRDRVFARVPGAGVVARAADGGTVVQLFGEIGFDVTAAGVARELDRLAGSDFRMQLNSPGGDAFEGLAVYNLLSAYPGHITTEVLGLAASAASIIAMAGAEVAIGSNAALMIHKSWALALGNHSVHDEVARLLQQLDGAVAETYSRKTGMSESEAMRLMDAETWMFGQTAIDMGFADRLLNDQGQQARMNFGLANVYRKVPDQLRGPAEREPVNSRGELEAILRRAGLRDGAARIVSNAGWRALEQRNDGDASTEINEAIAALKDINAALDATR